jgi:hypothetical protein
MNFSSNVQFDTIETKRVLKDKKELIINVSFFISIAAETEHSILFDVVLFFEANKNSSID